MIETPLKAQVEIKEDPITGTQVITYSYPCKCDSCRTVLGYVSFPGERFNQTEEMDRGAVCGPCHEQISKKIIEDGVTLHGEIQRRKKLALEKERA